MLKSSFSKSQTSSSLSKRNLIREIVIKFCLGHGLKDIFKRLHHVVKVRSEPKNKYGSQKSDFRSTFCPMSHVGRVEIISLPTASTYQVNRFTPKMRDSVHFGCYCRRRCHAPPGGG